MAGTPRFKQTVSLFRLTVGVDGELDDGPEVLVKGTVFRRRGKAIIVQGEVEEVTAQGWLDVKTVSGTTLGAIEPKRADIVAAGVRYQVLNVVSGEDLNNLVTHVGVELRQR